MQQSPDIEIRSGPWDIVEIQDFLSWQDLRCGWAPSKIRLSPGALRVTLDARLKWPATTLPTAACGGEGWRL